MSLDTVKRLAGIVLLFSVIGWFFYLQLPLLDHGYLNAGDDHVHVAYSNELSRIWQGEGRPFGWSRLYGAGAPIFLLRPPGFYQATFFLQFLSGLTVEEALKMVVIFGFCLFPLTMFAGARLLGVGFFGSLVAGIVSPMGISLWGHTIDAYQHLGVHKQLIAILLFPIAVGALWQLLKEGRYGLLFSVTFAAVFITHPYIAYCLALLFPLMFAALLFTEPKWDWKTGIPGCLWWSVPTVLWICIWLIPFVTSPEIQVQEPYAERRDNFDVVVLTTAETLRQYFLGGILDTTRYAGAFGNHEWGWLANSKWFRLPFLTALSFTGWLVSTIRPRYGLRGFMSLAFIAALVLFTGPDDFPRLEWIPFSEQFQNIHAVFLLEWAAFILCGMAVAWLFEVVWGIRKKTVKWAVLGILGSLLLFGYGTMMYERTMSGKRLIDLRNVYTETGELIQRKRMNIYWRHFTNVVRNINTSNENGNIAAYPQQNEDSVLYNLLPLMTDRPVFISGFEKVGGLYELLARDFRTALRDNYHIQRLFNVRFVVNSPYFRKQELDWHSSTEKLYRNKYWELVRIKGDFDALKSISPEFVGFAGEEREWGELMRIWLFMVERGHSPPWLINLSNSGLDREDMEKIRPFIDYIILGSDSGLPECFSGMQSINFNFLETLDKRLSELKPGFPGSSRFINKASPPSVSYEEIRSTRQMDEFRINVRGSVAPVIFKQAFYRGWQAGIDGESTKIYRVSPGLQMVFVPMGEHTLTWTYTGPNNWGPAWMSFPAGILFAFFLLWRERVKRKRSLLKEPVNPLHGSLGSNKYLPYAVTIVCAFFVLVFSYKTVSEAWLKVPVIILPHNGDKFETGNGVFYWNYISGIKRESQEFFVQVASDPGFENIVAAKRIDENHLELEGLFEGEGPYYFRVKSIIDSLIHGWSDSVRFYGAGGPGGRST